jgi:ADP-ribose pyrophosphatase
MHREYPSRPIPSVGVIVFKSDEVLLVMRGQEPSKGKWSIPGGVVELGEPIREAARREVLEECGVEVKVGDVVDVLDSILRDEEGRVQYHYVLVDLVASYVKGELGVGSDIEDARWVREEQVASFDMTARTPLVIRKAFRERNLDFGEQRS